MKGSAVREFLRWYETRHATDALRGRVLATLPPDLAAAVDPRSEAFGILASDWYDARIVHALLDAATAGLDADGRRRLAREGVRAALAASVKGVYRVVIERLSTPELYARNIQRLWGLLHDSGRREIAVDGPGKQARSSVWAWGGHHPFLCEIVSETTGQLFEKMGCRDVVVERVSCVSEGEMRCESRLAWR